MQGFSKFAVLLIARVASSPTLVIERLHQKRSSSKYDTQVKAVNQAFLHGTLPDPQPCEDRLRSQQCQRTEGKESTRTSTMEPQRKVVKLLSTHVTGPQQPDLSVVAEILRGCVENSLGNKIKTRLEHVLVDCMCLSTMSASDSANSPARGRLPRGASAAGPASLGPGTTFLTLLNWKGAMEQNNTT